MFLRPPVDRLRGGRRKTGTSVVKNLSRPSESVKDMGSFDSVRLTPHSAHDDSAFFDRRNSTGEHARHSIVLFLLLVALGQELILALFGLREDGGVFGRLAEFGEQWFELQVLIGAIAACNR